MATMRNFDVIFMKFNVYRICVCCSNEFLTKARSHSGLILLQLRRSLCRSRAVGMLILLITPCKVPYWVSHHSRTFCARQTVHSPYFQNIHKPVIYRKNVCVFPVVWFLPLWRRRPMLVLKEKSPSIVFYGAFAMESCKNTYFHVCVRPSVRM
jgi:hypothetical protein